MSEINTGKILDGITLALRAAYPDCQIESDTIEQGLTPPAFLVVLVSAEQENGLANDGDAFPALISSIIRKRGGRNAIWPLTTCVQSLN